MAKPIPRTIHELKANNKSCGRHFFEPATLRFFKSKVGTKLFKGRGKVFFVTSEQHRDDQRRYTVRSTRSGCDIDTVGKFQEHGSRRAAETAAKKASGK